MRIYNRGQEILEAFADWRAHADKAEAMAGVQAAQQAWEKATDCFDNLAGQLVTIAAATVDGVLANAKGVDSLPGDLPEPPG